jgi:peptidoglycan/xylan/chitin deacetylase (PgdA/CDA1 family)
MRDERADAREAKAMPNGTTFDRLLILMYHRIAHSGLDPWNLCVTPEHFQQQIEVLSRDYELIRLSDVPTAEDLRGKAVITFDDGYLDNLLIAKPMLDRCEAPATVFVSTGYVGANRDYWWDELERLVLGPHRLPSLLDLGPVEEAFRFEFSKHTGHFMPIAEAYRDWKVTYDGTPPPTERHALFLDLWRRLQASSEERRKRILDFLCAWAGVDSRAHQERRPMNAEELGRLVQEGLVEVGSHCVTHASLTAMDQEHRQKEIRGSKVELDTLLGVNTTTLAYPHGEFDRGVLEATKDAGYECAVGTNRYRVEGFDKRYQLRRLPVPDVPGDAFGAILLRRQRASAS